MNNPNETPARHPGETLPAVGMIITRIARRDRNGACIAGDYLRDCRTVADVADLGIELLTSTAWELTSTNDLPEDVLHGLDSLDRSSGRVDWQTFNLELIRVADLVFARKV